MISVINKISHFIIIILFLYSCSGEKNHSSKEYVTSGLKTNITLPYLDSIISEDIYYLRLNTLEDIIFNEICLIEATKYGISSEAYKYDLLYDNNSNSINELSLLSKKKYYTDSLKKLYNIDCRLIPDYFRKVNLSFSSPIFIGNKNSTDTINIISDLHCHNCLAIKDKTIEIINKYKEIALFRFILVSDYIDYLTLACYAANRQEKFIEMYSNLSLQIKAGNESYELNHLKEIAYGIKIDTLKFTQDLNDGYLLKDIIYDKTVLSENRIYNVPTFIVNNILLDGDFSINYLETVIKREINLD